MEALKGFHASQPRNTLIADVCFKGGLIDTWGRGIQKIYSACKEAGLPEPEIKEFQTAYFELSKLVKTEAELDTDLDKWLYVLKNMSGMNKIPVYLRKPIFEKLFNIAEYSNLTKEEKTMYDTSLKRKWDNKAVLDYAVNEAVKEADLKAREEERTKAELEKRKIALEFKNLGVSVSDIAKGTGLSIDEIEKL